nr:tRNA lysidine(34) synthetase TilS [Lachnospiraceae bacterium]
MLDITEFINEKNLLEDGDGVLLGVSGGADSVCLLFQFMKVMESIDIHLHVLYVEHGIRGEESKEDGRFVKALCDKLYMPYTLISVDAPAYARQRGLSMEEAARELRYEAFSTEASRMGLNKIATAHNANDNAETILFQMIRGTGVKGLAGIEPLTVRKNYTLIRPLLNTSRGEIEGYLEEIGQSYRTDSTNLKDDYARNKIRHQIIPLMEEINAKAINHINQAGRAVGKMFQGVEADAFDLLYDMMDEKGLNLWHLRQMKEQSRSEVIMAWLRLEGAAHNITRAHVEMI